MTDVVMLLTHEEHIPGASHDAVARLVPDQRATMLARRIARSKRLTTVSATTRMDVLVVSGVEAACPICSHPWLWYPYFL
jgi:hypothetical protein